MNCDADDVCDVCFATVVVEGVALEEDDDALTGMAVFVVVGVLTFDGTFETGGAVGTGVEFIFVGVLTVVVVSRGVFTVWGVFCELEAEIAFV